MQLANNPATKTGTSSQGFTIVELLIVVVVIGILAAISVVSYSGIINDAKIASMLAELTQWKTAADIHKVRKGHDAGRSSRLLYSQSSDNGGTYEYFICTAKQRRLCSTPAICVEHMEATIAATVAAEAMSAEAMGDILSLITEAIDDLLLADREAKAQLRRQLQKLEAQEEGLIELAANSSGL